MPTGDEISIWMRPEAPGRLTPGPQRSHSRSSIVAAAIAVADADGIEAASMRRIAAEIGAGAMTLYHYVPNREDLIELMVDQVVGEMQLTADSDQDWRTALSQVAHQRRALWLRHPWLATRTPGHPIWGPNSLNLQEFLLTALDGFDLTIDEVLSLTGLLNGYVESHVRAEVGWAQEAQRTKIDMQEWIRRTRPYARELVANGKYPMFAKMLLETATPHMEPDQRFQYGLDRVLDSIAASLKLSS